MRKVLLATMLCSLVLLSGCQKKDEPRLPKSVKTYETLNLTSEQYEQIHKIREEQKNKIENIRNSIETKRKAYVDFQKGKDISDPKVVEYREKYRAEVNELSVALQAERVNYDNSFMNILDDNQKKIYQKYIKQREEEKEKRLKSIAKNRALK